VLCSANGRGTTAARKSSAGNVRYDGLASIASKHHAGSKATNVFGSYAKQRKTPIWCSRADNSTMANNKKSKTIKLGTHLSS